MSCSTTTSTTCNTVAASCTCCHVQNVTVDNQLCVGNETILRTYTAAGGALLVQNGCCTQTSGNLAHICGESGQIALNVENGKVQIDPNEDLADTTTGVSIRNSTIQTGGQLVRITGTVGQTALQVASGDTDLNTGTTTVATLTDGTAYQTGGQYTGVRSIVIDPDSVGGGGLTISNSTAQTSDQLVQINGTTGQTALQVTAGDTDLNTGTTTVATLTDGTAYQTGGQYTGVRSIVIDPDSVGGGGLTISNSTAQTSDQLVQINGTTGQTALQVTAGDTTLSGVTTVASLVIINQPSPTSAGDTGETGEIRTDSNYIYVCIATNTWKRVATVTW